MEPSAANVDEAKMEDEIQEAAAAPGSASEPVAGAELPPDAFLAEDPNIGPLDWGEVSGAAEEAHAFQMTAEFRRDLLEPVSESAAADMRAAADLAEARADALPAYLQLEQEAWRQRSPQLAEMQAIKMREFEFVRFRRVDSAYPMDAQMQAVLQGAAGGGG